MLRLAPWWSIRCESLLQVVIMLGVDEVDEFDNLQRTNYSQQYYDLHAVYVYLIVDDNIVVHVASCIDCLRFVL